MGISDVGAASDRLNSLSGVPLLNTRPLPPTRDVISVPGSVPWSQKWINAKNQDPAHLRQLVVKGYKGSADISQFPQRCCEREPDIRILL